MVRSIFVPTNYEVTLYEQQQFQGAKITINGLSKLNLSTRGVNYDIKSIRLVKSKEEKVDGNLTLLKKRAYCKNNKYLGKSLTLEQCVNVVN